MSKAAIALATTHPSQENAPNAIHLRKAYHASILGFSEEQKFQQSLRQRLDIAGYTADARNTIVALATEAFAAATTRPLNEEAKPALTLPAIAPELYVGNRGGKMGGENIVDFMQRVWTSWIEAGALSRPALRLLDPKADEAITNWCRKKEWPAGLHIPTKAELTEVAAASAGFSREVPIDHRAAQAIYALAQRQKYSHSNR